MRQATTETLGLGHPLAFFKNGRLPVTAAELVERVFGGATGRGALVISGGNGIVGSGKAMQLGARLLDYGVPVVTLDLPDAPPGLKGQMDGLIRSFGPAGAAAIAANIVQMTYDGRRLPATLTRFNPRFVLEAIPEVLAIKRAHYALWREVYPEITIRSVTSGFPSRELGVGVFHPSFPHPINKVWEVVEDSPSDAARLLWALGLVPVPVGDYWSFILDVLFCGVTLAALRFQEAANMPAWKVDKLVRLLVGPNPLRAHDAIGAGASFLTWSCLYHLAGEYGDLFQPAAELERRKASGETWYSSFRPVVDRPFTDGDRLEAWILGPLLQMTSLILRESRAHLAHINAIGEMCAQFTRGVPVLARSLGTTRVIEIVERYHRLHPEAATRAWHPEAFLALESPEGAMLYVNAGHDGTVGVVTISREALNGDVIAELNRAFDWLIAEGIERVILSGDFHLSTQMIGADTGEFYPALTDEQAGFNLSSEWTRTARRLFDGFKVSVGFIGGKRCLGGMLELMEHCHFVVAERDTQLGLPEVTLPVVPGMDGTHILFRRAKEADWSRVAQLLMTGKAVKAADAVGWLCDRVGTTDEALAQTWGLAMNGSAPERSLRRESLKLSAGLFEAVEASTGAAGRQAIAESARDCVGIDYETALERQARHSAGFMIGEACRKGAVGSAARRVLG